MSLVIEQRGPVGWLRLDRADAMNALNAGILRPAIDQLHGWGGDASVRVVAITGTGRAFCAGADLREILQPAAADGKDLLDLGTQFYAALRNFRKPLIGAVNGVALAGGLEILLACDLVIAAESARFGDAHANYAVLPGGGSTAVLSRRLPPNVAKYLLLTGETLTALQLHSWGFVNEVVPDADLVARVQQLGEALAAKSPLVLARLKALANAALDRSVADALLFEQLESRAHMHSHDFREGLDAFASGRQPKFEGR
ncbi:MAG TPA: enoyl-CoA hydratase/isomerase family protein [Steroidobacter sp.]|uniref:enoyl-CoA hydratase/isomerase family protein n=1 Tax=Steroidobacter sp. TaxID=1978227 RepID=UPI002EDB2B7B